MITFSRSHWSKDRSGYRKPVTVPCATAGGTEVLCCPESAVSTIALPNSIGRHTLQHPMMASTLPVLLVLVQDSARITLTSVIGIY